MADRKSMAVESPADGYVYYGRCTRGKWPGVDAMASQLQEGGKLTPNNVFMTIVSPRPLRVRADVAEKDLYRLAKGLQRHGRARRLSGHETPDHRGARVAVPDRTRHLRRVRARDARRKGQARGARHGLQTDR